jgi:type I restriction enzyme S subunit
MLGEKKELSSLIEYQKNFIIIEDNVEYKRCTVKINRQGIVLRDIVKGSHIKTKKQQVCKAGQLLVAEIDAKVGGYGIVPQNLDGAIVSSHYFLFNIDTIKLYRDYLKYFLKTDQFFSQIKAQGTTNYAAIRPKDVLITQIPLPALDEQQRIASVVDDFTVNNKVLDINIKKSKSILDQIRQSILQEAVQGKLVPQEPNDEPASELLKKIKAEKERLIKEKKIKKEKPLPPIKDEEIPYELPGGWEWCKLYDVSFVTKLAGFEYTDHFVLKGSGDVPVIRAQNVKMSRLDETNLLYIDQNTSDLLERSALTKKCILMTFIGAGIGDVAIFDKKRRYHLAPNVAKVEVFNSSEINLMEEYLLFIDVSHRKKTSAQVLESNCPTQFINADHTRSIYRHPSNIRTKTYRSESRPAYATLR